MKPFMNKLRKGHHGENRQLDDTGALVQSRTMTLAQAVALPARQMQVVSSPLPVAPFPPSVKPKTITEQYWAARALTAEALLSVKASHHQELRQLTVTEAERRTQELSALNQMHEVQQAKLEKFGIFLISSLVALVSALIYTLAPGKNASKDSRSSRPLHFTIPILSPFTSVVEHETSLLNTRTLMVIGMICACLAYACFRYWLAHRATMR